MQYSDVETQLSHLRARDRRAAGLDGIALFNETALRHIKVAPDPPTPLSWMLSLLEIAAALEEPSAASRRALRRLDKGSSARAFLNQRHGTRFVHKLDIAIRADAEVINPWVRNAAGYTVALVQATELIDQVNESNEPLSWTMSLAETAGERWLLDQTRLRANRPIGSREGLALDAMDPCISHLNSFLAAADLDAKRDGAYQTILSTNPDKVSQAANSGVELLDHLGRLDLHNVGMLSANERVEALAESRGVDHSGRRLDVDLTLDSSLRACAQLRRHLNRMKHGRDRSETATQIVLRCLVALDAVLIVVTGVVQVPRTDPQLRWALTLGDERMHRMEQTLARLAAA